VEHPLSEKCGVLEVSAEEFPKICLTQFLEMKGIGLLIDVVVDALLRTGDK
jgi:hypothetical protein